MQLAGKTVVITGAAGGIGRALVTALAVQGKAHVWATDIDQDRLRVLQADLEKQGVAIHTCAQDVTDAASHAQVLAHILSTGAKQIDIWINNAGIEGLGRFSDQDPDLFDRVMRINFDGVAQGTRVALAHMEESGSGKIVNIASVASHVPAPYMSSYVASKFAVLGFSRSLQTELAFDGSPVSLLIVCPGFVETNIIKKGAALGYPEWLSWALSSPEVIGRDVLRALRKGEKEITPTLSGKVMKQVYRHFPGTAMSSSKAFLAKSFKDYLLNRFDTP